MDRREFLSVTGRMAILSALGPLFHKASAQGLYLPVPYKHPTLGSDSTEPVGKRIINYLDISGSRDDEEYKLDKETLAETIESADFKNAIFYPGGPQSVALAFADFGSLSELRIGWLDVRKGQEYKLIQVAKEIRELPRRESGGTSQVAALTNAALCLDNCPWQAKRSIVDLFTDGAQNTNGSNSDVKNNVEMLARNQKATINALITLDEADFEKWVKDYLLTPPGFFSSDGSPLEPGFCKIVATQRSSSNDPGNTGGQTHTVVEYHKAVQLAYRRKLILETAGIELEDLRKLDMQRINGGSLPLRNML
jgi:hypothetical protein